MQLARLVLRRDPGSETETMPTCEGSNEYDGRMGVRISSIFVILVGSTWGRSLSFTLHHVVRRLLLSI
jgi:zinc transporter 1/2/3